MTAESPAQTVPRLFPLLAEGRSADAAALFATVHDGRITRYHLYEDTHAVARAYFGG